MGDTVSIAVRFALYVDLMLLFGVPAFLLSVAGRGSGDRVLTPPTFVTACATAALALSAAGIVLLAASLSGAAVTDVDPAAVRMLVSGTATRPAWLVRIAALLLTLVIALVAGRVRFAGAGVVRCGGVALATLAWFGHGAADDGLTGVVHLAADIGHLVAAGIWVGALAAVVVMMFRPTANMDAERLAYLYIALARFAEVGTVAVGHIVFTGLINS